MSDWASRLWDFDKHYQSLGGSGGAGVGYGAPAAIGAALANKKHGRLSVTIQGDGDLLYAPGVLVDGGASPDSAARGHAQQPRLPSGSDAPAAHGQPAQSRHHPRAHRHDDRQSERRISRRSRRAWACTRKGPITNPNDLGPAHAARDRGRQARRAVAHRRRHAAAIEPIVGVAGAGFSALVPGGSQ